MIERLLLRYAFVLSAVLISLVAPVCLGESPDVDAYLREADDDFRRAYLKLPPERQEHWAYRKGQLLHEVVEYGESLRNRGYSSYDFLVPYNRRLLENATSLAEGAGRDYLLSYIDGELASRLDRAFLKASLLRWAPGRQELKEDYEELLALKRRGDKLRHRPQEKLTYEYRPKTSAYDDEPSIDAIFILYDWQRAYSEASEVEEKLSEVEDSLTAAAVFNDPYALTTILSQIASIAIAIAMSMVSFGSRPSPRWVAALALTSILATLLLVFLSSNTLVNMLSQVLITAGFLLSWAFRAKK